MNDSHGTLAVLPDGIPLWLANHRNALPLHETRVCPQESDYLPCVTSRVVKALACRLSTLPLPLAQIVVSKKWGFTKWPRSEYKAMREKGILQPDGVCVQYKPEHGPLKHWEERQE